jgi:hypothetical protein
MHGRPLATNRRRAELAPGGFVKKLQTLSFLATLAVVIGMVSWGSTLNAQTTPSTTPDRQAQQPSSSPDATPTQQTPQTPQTQPTPSPEMPPSSQQAPTAQTPNSQSGSQSQTPDTTAPDSSKPSTSSGAAGAGATDTAGGTQTFSGTVVKQGDKYVLKDDAGKTYDIDHQTDVAKFEGKRVRVQGTLDSNGKILVK